jgi:hypothetical protein
LIGYSEPHSNNNQPIKAVNAKKNTADFSFFFVIENLLLYTSDACYEALSCILLLSFAPYDDY